MKRMVCSLMLSFFLFQIFLSSEELEMGIEWLLLNDIPQVVTSTLSVKKAHIAPSSMTVITEDYIKRSGARKLFELLDQMPGILSVIDQTGRTLFTIRNVVPSFGNDKIKFMINGHTIMEPVYSGFSFYDIGVEHIKQIEIIKGPGSALYGTNAFAGIINIITKDAQDYEGTEIDLKYGSFDSVQANLSYSKAFLNDVDFTVNYNYLSTDGQDDLIFQSDGLPPALSLTPSPQHMARKTHHVCMNLNYRNLEVNAAHVDFQADLPFGIFFYTQDPSIYSNDYSYIEASYLMALSNDLNLKIKGSVDYNQFDQSGFVNKYAFISPYLMLEQVRFFEDAPYSYGYDSLEIRSEVLFDWQMNDSNHFITGFFYEHTDVKNVYSKSQYHPILFTYMPGIVDYSSIIPWNKEENRHIYGAFVQNEWSITNEMYLLLGARYDNYSDFGSSTNPRCGFVWNINNHGGAIKVLYGEAFKAPNFNQLYSQNNPLLVGNPNLDAEKIRSYEISYYDIYHDLVNINVNLYYSETKDLVDISEVRLTHLPGFPRFYVNRNKTESKGLELDLKYFYKKECYISMGYIYSDDVFADTDIRVPFTSENQVTAELNHKFNDQFNFFINYEYVSDIARYLGDFRTEMNSVSVLDMAFVFNLNDQTRFTLGVYNALDEDIYTPSEVTDQNSDWLNYGRSLTLSFKKQF